MGGGSGGKTTTQSNTPWSGQQPYLRDLFGEAQQLYNRGPQQYFPGNTVAAFSPQTQMGLDMATQQGMNPDPSQAAFGSYLTGTMGMGNLNPYSIAQGGYGAMGGIGGGMNMLGQAGQPMSFGTAQNMSGGMLPGAMDASQQFVGNALGNVNPNFGGTYQQIQNMGGAGVDPTAASQLGATASGGYLGANPYLDNVYNTAASRLTERFNEDIMPGIAAQFGASGRTGSGLHQLAAGRASGELTDSLGKLGADIYAPAYESERGRQVQAAGTLGQLGLGAAGQGLSTAANIYGMDLGQQLGAAQLGGDLFSRLNQADLSRRGLASDLYTGGLDRQLAAGQALGNIGLGGMEGLGGLYSDIGQQQFRAGSLAPTLQAMQFANADRLMNVGGTIEDQAQRLIDSDVNRWNFMQQAPWQNLSNYANTIYGLPGSYGTTTTQGPEGSRFQGALGGAMSGAAMGSIVPGIGTGIGAGLGALMGILG